MSQSSSDVVAPSGGFATTHWTMIAAARGGDVDRARVALAELCRLYWYPLYAFVRRKGHDADSAQDLTQEFFARLLEKDFLDVVDPAKGRFRSFLLAACQHFLANERDRARALKRGGGMIQLPLEFANAEDRYANEPGHSLTPERLFERRWATTLLAEALVRLRGEYEEGEREIRFDRLKSFLTQPHDTAPYRELAVELEMTEGALRVAVHRLRQRYREVLEAQIAQTVDSPDQVEEEIRCLFSALAC